MQKIRYPVLAALAMAVVCVACTRKPTIKQYQNNGIQFSYYSDWAVTKDAPVDGNPNVRTINIEGPDNAVIVMICLPASNDKTLEEYAAAVAKSRDAAIEGKLSLGPLKGAEVRGTSEPTTGKVAGQEQQGILQQFTINLLGTQVPHEAKFFMIRGSRYKTIVMSQVATASAAATHPASELILSSLTAE
ncbi:MAG TPA: hypothetical protein VK738_08285 [Terriglobales bacterium]|jgi:hypothetical protein|nr:hypothetical protein [Terriglobales bacterium]